MLNKIKTIALQAIKELLHVYKVALCDGGIIDLRNAAHLVSVYNTKKELVLYVSFLQIIRISK